MSINRTRLAACIGVAAPLAIGVLNGSFVEAQSQIVAVPESLKIEVASIKPNNSNDPGPVFRPYSGGFSVVGIAASLLVEMAYGIQHFQISGAPGWVDSQRFDIIAKLEGVTGMVPPARMAPALQSLLADRFRLKVHREVKEGSTFALLVASGGAKLQTAAGLRPTGASAGYLSGSMDLATLSNWLTWRLERPVLNETGLAGVYDIELIWTLDAADMTARLLPPPMPPPPPPSGGMPRLPNRMPPPPNPSGPSIFTALQEQLGLKLESRKGPVDELVFDHIEQPTQN